MEAAGFGTVCVEVCCGGPERRGRAVPLMAEGGGITRVRLALRVWPSALLTVSGSSAASGTFAVLDGIAFVLFVFPVQRQGPPHIPLRPLAMCGDGGSTPVYTRVGRARPVFRLYMGGRVAPPMAEGDGSGVCSRVTAFVGKGNGQDVGEAFFVYGVRGHKVFGGCNFCMAWKGVM